MSLGASLNIKLGNSNASLPGMLGGAGVGAGDGIGTTTTASSHA